MSNTVAQRLGDVPANLTPAELFFMAGVMVERGHHMNVSIAASVWARTFHGEVLQVAEARGFTDRKRLREAFRVGKPTPRGQRRTQDAISRITPAEFGMLVERARRMELLMSKPAAFYRLPPCPVFSLHRVTAVEVEA